MANSKVVDADLLAPEPEGADAGLRVPERKETDADWIVRDDRLNQEYQINEEYQVNEEDFEV